MSFVDGVPAHLLPGLEAWRDDGVVPGDFLCAVLRNDLAGAFLRADEVSAASMQAIVWWCWNNLPASSWGGEDAMRAWRRKFSGDDDA